MKNLFLTFVISILFTIHNFLNGVLILLNLLSNAMSDTTGRKEKNASLKEFSPNISLLFAFTHSIAMFGQLVKATIIKII